MSLDRIKRLLGRTVPRTWVLKRRLEWIDRKYSSVIFSTEGMERERAINDREDEAEPLRQELRDVSNGRLMRKAQRLGVPTPPYSYAGYSDQEGNWEYVGRNSWTLSEQGYRKLLADVRAEQRERDQRLFGWTGLVIGLLGAIAAVLGALVALISIC